MRARRRTLCEDVPGDIRQGFDIARTRGVAQSHVFAVKHNAASVEGRSQTFEKQATIAAREKMNGEKKFGLHSTQRPSGPRPPPGTMQ